MSSPPRSGGSSSPPSKKAPSSEELALHAEAIVAVAMHGQPPALIPFEVVAKWCTDFSANRLIGEGAFGKVYSGMCHNSQSARMRLAVKRHMRKIKAAADFPDPDLHSAVDSIRREINLLRQFHHPHIIRLLGYSMPLGRAEAEASYELCLIYEHAGYGGLDKMLKVDSKAGLLTWPRRLRILLQIAKALNFMHKRFAQPAFHRDVKSANVVVTDDLTAKVIDCGLSKYVPSAAQAPGAFSVAQSLADMRFGTPQYMCPSYLKFGTYDAKSEIFSFGIVIAEVLTGCLQSSSPDNPNDFSEEDAIDKKGADARAGDWPAEVIAELKDLAKACTAKASKRIGNMTTVMQRLANLAGQYAPDTADQTADQLAEARKALDALKLNEEFLAMQRDIAECASVECCTCFDSHPADAGVACSGASPHFYCNECFSRMVLTQVTGDFKRAFIDGGLAIECSCCQPEGFRNVFNMQLCMPRLTPAAYSAYLSTLAEPAVIQAQREAMERFERQLRELEERMAKQCSDAAISGFVKHIQDRLIVPRCPNPSCQVQIADFNNCAHLECGKQPNGKVVGGCGSHVCAWCMQLFPDRHSCQSHVHGCSLNANPSNLFPVESTHPGVWREVQNGLARARVKQYIASQVPQELRQAVTDYIQAQFPEIQLAHRDPAAAAAQTGAMRLWPKLLKAIAVGLAACVAVSILKASWTITVAASESLVSILTASWTTTVAASESLVSRLKASWTTTVAASKSLVVSLGLIAAAAFFVASSRLQKKGKFRAYPPLQGTDDADGFTANSIRARLPRIIDDVIATMPALSPAVVDNLQSLRLEIASNCIISPLFETSAQCERKGIAVVDPDQEPEWPSYDRELLWGQCRWQSAPWFVCETYFYRKIRAIMKAHNGPVDPFSAQKQSLLDSLDLPFERHVLALMKSNSTISEAIFQSLLGNKGDLSLHSVAASIGTISDATSVEILSDQRSEALRLLRIPRLLRPTARVAIILDNCGLELVSDLMLAALLLQSNACASVHLLCKKRCVWVSDVMEHDIQQHLTWAQSLEFDDEESAAANAKFVAFIQSALDDNRISIIAHEFLSGPEAFDKMPADLVSLFQGCSLVICKGGANYRRLLGDRRVPRDAFFSLLTDYFPSPLLALRTYK